MYTISLIVNDGTNDSVADEVEITVQAKPIASVVADRMRIRTGDTVNLNGFGSRGPEGVTLFYTWSLVVPTTSTTAALSYTIAAAPHFIADVAGDYVVTLIVSDGVQTSQPATVTVTAVDTNTTAPTADAGPDQSGTTHKPVTLDGSGSTDPENDDLTYTWTVVTVPAQSFVNTASLTGANPVSVSFVPDLAGRYTLFLVVNDGTLDSLKDEVVISVVAAGRIAEHTNQIQANYRAASGKELGTVTSIPLTSGGVTIGTVTPLGYSYCMPPVPTAPPPTLSTPPTPPRTVYGCDNDLTVTHLVAADAASVTFTWMIPKIFLDAEGTLTRGNNNINFDAYVEISNVVVIVPVALQDKGNGFKAFGAVDVGGDAVLTFVSLDITGDNAVDNALIQAQVGDFQPAIQARLKEDFLAYVKSKLVTHTTTALPTEFLLN